MIDIIPTIGVVVIRDDRILLVRHEAGGNHVVGTYGLPAGRLKDDETEQEGAAREFNEETGLHAKTVDFREFENNYFVADVPRKDGQIVKMGWKVFKLNNFLGDMQANDETTPEWFDYDKIEKLEKNKKLAPNVLNAINAALK